MNEKISGLWGIAWNERNWINTQFAVRSYVILFDVRWLYKPKKQFGFTCFDATAENEHWTLHIQWIDMHIFTWCIHQLYSRHINMCRDAQLFAFRKNRSSGMNRQIEFPSRCNIHVVLVWVWVWACVCVCVMILWLV